ncbi:MAG: pyridoxal phosphate-dependent aminotransferase [Bacteroidetes bacterium]|nr:pyridoxal phosphate-dependent aminotransferase [Bacteroidota bacterium]
MSRLADRITHLSESQTIAMAKLSRELQEQGRDIISLSLGEPDFVTPENIRESAKKAIDEGFTFYTPIAGFADLRKAISDKFKNENNLDYAPDQIVVSTGAKQSIANIILSLVNPGEEVIVPAPYWVSYTQMIKLAEGVPVYVDSNVESDYKITPEQLRKAITPKTKMFIFSSPCNPSGTVYTKSELEGLARVMAEHKELYIISDEIYEHINFNGKHESIAQFDFIKDQVIIVNGVSKGYAMTGWRIGYIGAPKWIAQACDKMQGQFTSGTSSISQKAATAALRSGTEFYDSMRTTYLRRRDLVVKMLKEIPGLKVNIPMGAFYVFPDVSAFFGKTDGNTVIQNATDLCMYLLNDCGVSMVTGEAFGDPRCIRLSYATSDEILVKALTRVKESLAKLH